jgi:hypothetical protein
MCDQYWELEEELGAARHEELGRMHLETARLMRERDGARQDNQRIRSKWDASMKLLDALCSRIEDVEAGDFPQFAQFASAEWVADNLGRIRLLVADWRDEMNGPF